MGNQSRQPPATDAIDRGSQALAELPVVAHATGTSPRTLRRRLSELGVSFNALLDALRRELARQYLRSGDESIANIAERLGFAGASAFQRAFQRWERMPPSTYRRLAKHGTREPNASSDHATE